jgi:hypothetical protein
MIFFSSLFPLTLLLLIKGIHQYNFYKHYRFLLFIFLSLLFLFPFSSYLIFIFK